MLVAAWCIIEFSLPSRTHTRADLVMDFLDEGLASGKRIDHTVVQPPNKIAKHASTDLVGVVEPANIIMVMLEQVCNVPRGTILHRRVCGMLDFTEPGAPEYFTKQRSVRCVRAVGKWIHTQADAVVLLKQHAYALDAASQFLHMVCECGTVVNELAPRVPEAVLHLRESGARAVAGNREAASKRGEEGVSDRTNGEVGAVCSSRRGRTRARSRVGCAEGRPVVVRRGDGMGLPLIRVHSTLFDTRAHARKKDTDTMTDQRAGAAHTCRFANSAISRQKHLNSPRT